MATEERFPLKWTDVYFEYGLVQRDSYKLEYRHVPQTGAFQYRYRPDGPHYSGSGEIVGFMTTQQLVSADLATALQGIVDDDDAGVSLADQRARWTDRMSAARAALNRAALNKATPSPA